MREVFLMINLVVGIGLDTTGRKYIDLSAWPMCRKPIPRHVKRLEGLTTRFEFRVIIFNRLNNS